MARKVTSDDILKMNELYYVDPVYSHVAKITGFSASTVKKYIIPDFKPLETREKISKELPSIEEISIPANLLDWLVLTEDEVKELEDFRKFEVQI